MFICVKTITAIYFFPKNHWITCSQIWEWPTIWFYSFICIRYFLFLYLLVIGFILFLLTITYILRNIILNNLLFPIIQLDLKLIDILTSSIIVLVKQYKFFFNFDLC